MANILTGLIPTIYKAMDKVLREQQGFIPAVSMDADSAKAAVGQTVRSFVAPASSAYDITPGAQPADNGDSSFGYIDLSLTKQRYVPIRWTGEELLSVGTSREAMLQAQFEQAFRTLSNEVETDLAGVAIAGASRAVGTAGTTPFGTAGDLSDAAALIQVLDENGVPSGDRHFVASAAATTNMRGKQSVLFKANEAGSDQLLRTGVIGDVLGMSVHTSRWAGLNAKGTGAGYLVNGAAAAGASAITVDTGTGTVLAGNVVTFAGDSNKYVTSGLSGSVLTLNKPGLVSAAADNVAITVGNNYTANVAFHKSAILLAARAPAMPMGGDGASDVEYVTDPVSGLTFQVAVYRQYKQIKIEIGLVWGCKVIKSDMVATLMG